MAHMEGADQVGFEHSHIFFTRKFAERRVVGDACVVDEHIDLLPKRFYGSLDQLFAVFIAGNVSLYGYAFHIVFLFKFGDQSFRQSLGAVGTIVDNHVVAHLAQTQRHGFPNSTGTARDNSGLHDENTPQ